MLLNQHSSHELNNCISQVEESTDRLVQEYSSPEVQAEDSFIEQIGGALEVTSDHGLLGQWIEHITPFLESGGKPVALILSLGVVSIPLLLSGNALVAPILAAGASIVAVIVAIRSYWA